MTQDEIIEMTRQAGGFDATPKFLETFAKLVAAKEREEWERRYTRLQSLMDLRETQPNKPCCLAEREACAKVCENLALDDAFTSDILQVTAAVIRARGEA
jgi:hypothetical protein